MPNSTGKSGAGRKTGAADDSSTSAGSRAGSKSTPNTTSKTRPVTAAPPKSNAKAKSNAQDKSNAKAKSSAKPKSKPRAKSTSTSPRTSGQGASGSRGRIPTVRPNGATVLVALVVILGIAVLAPTAQRYIAQRQYVAQLQAELTQTQQSVDEIATERDRWSDPAYIQSQARGRLLFVMPGDTSYLVLDPPATTKQQQSNISTDLHETQSSWLDSFAESLVTAGTAPAPTPTD
ncbi:cell division protein FtsB [Pseudoclavibacter sp. JAI123]|uniref:FtsB family cell division protein n=1 Tax=Pseudoclavibacter sp. JAI123 TaxID=2723065 RepID=UPI0015C99736|nr:septum formation initiator family protein [Pseudoclavibacter sp. JAI123]NYF13212.1 cell division protein FtsB [Pseudoclavibacter sp. JAI123]